LSRKGYRKNYIERGGFNMKRIVLASLLILGFLCFLGANKLYAQAEEKPKPLELDETEWGIQLTTVDEKGKEKISEDTIIFKDGKVNSESYEQKKYDASNYTLSVKDDGATVFETMQTKDEDKVFWRGEIRDKGIRGILSAHPKSGGVIDYSFVGGLKSGLIGEEKEAAKRAAEQKALETKRAAKATEEAAAKVAVQEEDMGEKAKDFWQKLTGKKQEVTNVTQEQQ